MAVQFYSPVQTAPKPFPARFPGRCVKCSLPIVEGQMLTRTAGLKFPHADCTASAEESQFAEFALSQRVNHGVKADAPAVNDGIDLSVLPTGTTYAAVPGSTGKLVFLQIDRPNKDKWLGWTFVKQYLGGQGAAQRIGSQKPGSAYKGQWSDMLAQVLADPKAAMKAFADELGICARCGRELTDEISRERGIGPVCYEAL